MVTLTLFYIIVIVYKVTTPLWDQTPIIQASKFVGTPEYPQAFLYDTENFPKLRASLLYILYLKEKYIERTVPVLKNINDWSCIWNLHAGKLFAVKVR